MRIEAISRACVRLALGLALVPRARAQDEPARPEAEPGRWKAAAEAYRIEIDAGRPTPLAFRAEPALNWTNPQRSTDDGSFFLWTDRGRPEAAASFYRYRRDGQSFEEHEFVSLSGSPLTARRGAEVAWAPAAGNIRPAPIPGAPRPAAAAPERLRQMKALAREFRVSFNNPPDLSEIRPLTQPLYRFEVEGKRDDLLDGALFAYVHATDPEVLLLIEARPEADGGRMAWHSSFARMSMVNLRAHRDGREVWSVQWATDLKVPSRPYLVRTFLLDR